MRAAARGAALLCALLPLGAGAGPPPEEAYRLHCSGCHGPDGAGTRGMAPTLRSLGPLLEAPGGRAYLARVPGVAQAPLDSADLARLVNWVLRELSQVRDFAPYEAGEIGAWRRQPLRDPLAARRALGVEP